MPDQMTQCFCLPQWSPCQIGHSAINSCCVLTRRLATLQSDPEPIIFACWKGGGSINCQTGLKRKVKDHVLGVIKLGEEIQKNMACCSFHQAVMGNLGCHTSVLSTRSVYYSQNKNSSLMQETLSATTNIRLISCNLIPTKRKSYYYKNPYTIFLRSHTCMPYRTL